MNYRSPGGFGFGIGAGTGIDGWDILDDVLNDNLGPGGLVVSEALKKHRAFFEAAIESVLRSEGQAKTVLGELWDEVKDQWPTFVAMTVAALGAEAAVVALAASPEPLYTKIAAAVLQAALLSKGGLK